MFWKRLVIGKPLKSNALSEQRLTKKKALAILSSDALSSVAYGPEQIFIALMVVGTAAFVYSIPIAIAIFILLLTLILSYRQIIHAYPHGGGAYAVSKENISNNAGLVAGSSLLIDYMLTVAVSVSAGADAITSAFPSLQAHNLLLSIIFVVILMLVNLRGINESATILMYPVYGFIGIMFLLLLVGTYKVMTGQVVDAPQVAQHFSTISLLIVLKAFASGSSALTGVEAISNAVPNFKKSEEKNAQTTLVMMGIILACLFLGIVWLSYAFHLVPQANNTLVSQLASHVFGHHTMYYIVQGVTAVLLVIAANTGFSAFPMLAVNLSKDHYLPRMFQARGDRLGYSNGIIALSIGAIIILIIFKGNTSQLIPLYAVGVFIPFTLAQFGMLLRWGRSRPKGWFVKGAINFIGALLSASVIVIFIVTKTAYVWPIFILLPVIVYILHRIRAHLIAVGEKMAVTEPFIREDGQRYFILPVTSINQITQYALHYAMQLKPDRIIAVHIAFDKEAAHLFEQQWKEWQPDIRLIIVQSPYRTVVQPMERAIHHIQKMTGIQPTQMSVIVPQLIPTKWWQYILHNQTGMLLRTALLYKKGVTVITVPYHIGLQTKK